MYELIKSNQIAYGARISLAGGVVMAELLAAPALVSGSSGEVVSHFSGCKVDIYSLALELVSLAVGVDIGTHHIGTAIRGP
jgi:hypothetical protein